MALHKVDRTNQPEDERRQEDTAAVKTCPICDGEMEVVYSRHSQQVVVCTDCHTGITVPAGAWNIARVKREAKWMPKP
jgi:ssDNA-binding Zn-finger/Zn-ribbon topoisomerase 1